MPRHLFDETGVSQRRGATGASALAGGVSERDTNICEVLESSWVEAEGFPDTGLRHFILCFKENTLEVLARDLNLSVHDEPYDDVIAAVVAKVMRD